MPLLLPDFPQEHECILLESIQEFLRLQPPEQINAYRLAAPHEVYLKPAIEIAEDNASLGGDPLGWRYLLLKNTRPVFTLFIPNMLANRRFEYEQPRMAEICWSRYGDRFIRACHYAEQLPDVYSDDYLIRCIVIPSMHFEAMWLSGHNDHLILFPQRQLGITSYALVSPGEAVVKLRSYMNSAQSELPCFGKS